MSQFDLKSHVEIWRQEVAEELLEHKHLPRRLQRLIGVLIFLFVSGLTLSGGVFMVATFMHVIITRMDMPPANPYPVYTVGQTQLMIPAPAHASGPANQVTSPNSSSITTHKTQNSSATAVQTPASLNHIEVTLIKRPTVGDALDQWIAHTQNPADAYVQEDAVDTGLYLSREVHDWLLSIFDRATRTANFPSVEPAGVPLTNGQ
ncbi:hypothetical protein [Sulfoacidibacillus ferrooxidans]|uniref:Uncharacterized protein n=1 Tax=Sulfoacidibacillus ferrooxidans TaxID=2005001 RepID=A0A9X2ACW4_9BACL|nr:hypothetical protein [Sulfoacidibacillus ferrooxidans]MCI0181901.1 hypothetical protein [Sulfoacidibacillus ferrooxidans]